MTTARTIDRLQVLAAAVLFSTGGAAIKACTLTSWQIVSLRSGIAAATLLLTLPAARRGWTHRTVVVAGAYAATMVLYVQANKLTTAAATIFLQSAAPLYILLLGPWLLREPTRRRDLVFMAALAGGMSLFFVGGQPAAVTAPEPLLGNLLGVLSGLFWGLTILGLRWLGREPADGAQPSAAAVACGNLIACVAALPMAVPLRSAVPVDWAIVGFLGTVQIALAYVFLTRGVRRVGALEVSLLLLLEPVLNPVWAWIVHDETPSEWALVGGAVILSATFINTLAGRRSNQTAAAGHR